MVKKDRKGRSEETLILRWNNQISVDLDVAQDRRVWRGLKTQDEPFTLTGVEPVANLSISFSASTSCLSSRMILALGSSLTTAWLTMRLALSAYLSVDRVSS